MVLAYLLVVSISSSC